MIADRDAVAHLNELAEVAFQLMMRKSSHRYWVRRVLISAGERQPDSFGSNFGIAMKQLIEVAHAKEEQGVATGRLCLIILLHHR